jgi:hypothetical protein
VPLSRVPDGSGFAEVHCYVEGSYIYVFHTLRYYTGEGTARGLSSYRPLSEGDLGPEAMTSHILHNNRNLYSGKWVTEDLAIQVLTIDPKFKIAFPVLHDMSLAPGQISRLADCLPIGLEAASRLALSVEYTHGSNAHRGVRLHIRGSNDGVYCDTEDLYTYDIPCKSSQRVRKTIDVNTHVKFVKVVIENLDPVNPVKVVDVTATVGN